MRAIRRGGYAGALLLVLLVAATALPGSQSALDAAPLELFSPAEPSSAADGEPDLVGYAGRGVLRSRFVEIDFDRLTAAAASPYGAEGTLILNLFDDAVLTVRLEQLTANPPHGFALSGRVEGVELSQVTMVIRDGVLAANAALPGAFYQVRPAGDSGLHVVRQIDQSAFPDEMEPVPVALQDKAPAAPLAEPADDGSVIDVLVVYTSAAEARVGDILAEIDLAVQETNDSYSNSGITQRLRLAHAAWVSYAESANFVEILEDLTDPGDGYLDEVHGLRNTYGADEVLLLVYYPGGTYCGVAWQMDYVQPWFEAYAFAVVDVDCAAGYYSFGHELGHNMGARHDWYVDEADTPYGHAHGYLNYTNPGSSYSWRTVMAYNTECAEQGEYCIRLPYWSNPTVSWYGVPMGVPEGTSTACVKGNPQPYCDADNRKTLNKTAYTVANFRASVLQPPAAPSGLTATAVSQKRIDLAWDDNSASETGFKIERSLAGMGAWSQIAIVEANVESYTDTGLTGSTSYDYRVRAYNAGGNSAYSNVATATTLGYIVHLPLVARSFVSEFDSQFNGSAAGWQALSGAWGIESNVFYVTDGVPSGWASASYASTYGELDYRARIWREGCEICSHGLLVRGSPEPLGAEGTWDSGYGFYIARDQFYAIYTYSNGAGTALQPWTRSTAINPGGAWNELRVVAGGSQLAFYINGGLVWIGSNAAHALGRVGLAMYRDPGSSGNKLWVDWATLVPQAPTLDAAELTPEQRVRNEAAWEEGATGSDGQAPHR